MRLRCAITVAFLLTLEGSECATQASCTIKSVEWRRYNIPDLEVNLTSCKPNIENVDDEDFTISTAEDPTILGFHIENRRGVRFLPKNLSLVFPDLVRLSVSECAVTDVRKEHFESLSKLRFLYLHDNQIHYIESNAFAELFSLEILHLYTNKIHSLSPRIFGTLLNLKLLNLGHNRIPIVDENIFMNLTNLAYLYFEHNNLEIIPKNLFKHNSKLLYIYFHNNKIKLIDPNTFDHLSDVKIMDFDFNLCVDRRYEATEFKQMRDDLKQNCNENSKIIFKNPVARRRIQSILDLITVLV